MDEKKPARGGLVAMPPVGVRVGEGGVYATRSEGPRRGLTGGPMEEDVQAARRSGARLLSADEVRRHAEMLVKLSEETGLPLDSSGSPGLDDAIAEARRGRSALVER